MNPEVFSPCPGCLRRIMKENELCEESEGAKEEENTGVSAEMAKEVADAKRNPPEEGV